MAMLVILFIVGAIVMAALVFFGTIDAQIMPRSCPRCHAGSDDAIPGAIRPWYQVHPRNVRCRSCFTWFKEHPNGSLVEDRDRN